MIKKLTSLEDLKKMNLYLFVNDKILEENHIESIIKSKGYSLADISRMTGISKQNISNLLTTSIPPNIEYVLKIAYVLDVSVESLYKYNKIEWYIPYNQDESLSYYVDIFKMEIILNDTRKERIESDDFTYIVKDTNTRITENEMKELLKEYTSFNVIKELAERYIKENSTISLSKAKKEVKAKQLEKFNQDVLPIYQKVYKKIIPKKIKKQK